MISRQVSSALRSARRFSTEPLEKTALYDLHLEKGGKMVPFAGYSLPVQYEGLGVLKEHNHCRAEGKASLFDVGHMGQIKWHGKDSVKFLEKMLVGDIASLKVGEGKLSLIMNEEGNIVDDTVVVNAGDYYYMVVNGACKHKDMAHFNNYMTKDFDVSMEYLSTQQLVALQGKGAMAALSKIIDGVDLTKMSFMTTTIATVAGIPNCRVTRCGYTGEDGFEISVDEKNATALASALLALEEVAPAGLGARDSLRLEAGLCLYGNDIDETTNPVEAGLVWTIGGPKSRRRLEQGFLGADKFLESSGKLKPVDRKRVGITGMKAPARAHTEIFATDGVTKIGELTSGGFGPTVGKPVGMGYVPTDYSKDDTEVLLNIRGKMHAAKVTKMPFGETHYYRA